MFTEYLSRGIILSSFCIHISCKEYFVVCWYRPSFSMTNFTITPSMLSLAVSQHGKWILLSWSFYTWYVGKLYSLLQNDYPSLCPLQLFRWIFRCTFPSIPSPNIIWSWRTTYASLNLLLCPYLCLLLLMSRVSCNLLQSIPAHVRNSSSSNHDSKVSVCRILPNNVCFNFNIYRIIGRVTPECSFKLVQSIVSARPLIYLQHTLSRPMPATPT